MFELLRKKRFANGVVYALRTADGYPLEVTDTFLPYYTKDAVGKKQNALTDSNLGSRSERWMIGVSTMSGCPVGCKFCATAKLKKCRNLTWEEIIAQVMFVLERNINWNPRNAQEFKINYTRMGEPFLNIANVRKAIEVISNSFPNVHHYVSTIGIEGSDFTWIKNNVTLQFSIHSFDEAYRDWLIPFPHKMSLRDLGQVRTQSNLKTTLNLTLARPEDFKIDRLKEWFVKERFFIKVSPINQNDVSKANGLGGGVITQQNLV